MADRVLTLILRVRDETKAALTALSAEVKRIAAGAKQAQTETANIGDALHSSAEPAGNLTAAIRGLLDTVTGLGPAVGQATDKNAEFARGAVSASTGLDGAASAGGRLRQALGLLVQGSGAANTGLQSTVGHANQLLGTSERLAASIRTLTIGLLGLGAVRALKSLADDAARVEVLGTVLNAVAFNAGISGAAVAKLDKQVQSLGITAAASRQSLTGFIQSGLDISKAAELARAAQDLAVIAGKNSSQVFEQVVLNIQQLDSQGLRFNGVIVDMELAYEKYARAAEKAVTSLSKAEKQQAVLNEVLVQGRKIAGVYENSLNDVGKQIQSLARLQNDLSVSLGNNLLPLYRALTEEFTLFLKQAKLQTTQLDEQGKSAKQLAENLRPLFAIIREIGLVVLEHIDIIGKLLLAYIGLKIVVGILGTIGTAMGLLAGAARGLVGAWLVLTGVEAAAAAARARSLTGLVLFQSVLRGLGTVFRGVGVAILGLASGAMPAFLVSLKAVAAAALASPFAPLVIGVIAVGAAVTGLIALYRSLSNSQKKTTEELGSEVDKQVAKRNAQLEEFKNITAEQIALLKQENEISVRLRIAQESGDAAGINAAKTELELLKAKKKELDSQREKIVANVQISKVEQAEILKLIELQLQENAVRTEQRKRLDAVAESLKKLGLAGSDARKGLDISQVFAEQLGAAKLAIDEFNAGLKEENGELKVTFEQVTKAVQELVTKAQTFDEITAAVRLVKNTVGNNGNDPLIRALVDTAEFNRGKAAIEATEKALAGMIGRIDETKKNAAFLRQIAQDSADFALSARKIAAETGNSFAVAANGIITLNSSLQSAAQTRRDLANIELAQHNTVIVSARARYNEELENINKVHAAQRELITRGVQENLQKNRTLLAQEKDATDKQRDIIITSSKTVEEKERLLHELQTKSNDKRKDLIKQATQLNDDYSKKLLALEKSTNEKRLENAKTLLEKLKGQQDELLRKIKDNAEKVKRIDQDIEDSRLNRKRALSSIEDKGLSDFEKAQKTRLAIQEAGHKAIDALATGDLEKAKKYNDERIALVEKLNGFYDAQAGVVDKVTGKIKEGAQSGVGQFEVVQATNDAYDQQEEILQRTKLIEREKQAKNVELVEAVTKAIEDLGSNLKTLTEDKNVKIKFDYDREFVQNLRKDLEQALTGLKFTVQGSVSGINAQGFATGGKINGPGTSTSDSILLWGSTGEFMLKARAVENYGEGFINRLNNLEIPRSAIPRFAEGGPISGPGTQVQSPLSNPGQTDDGQSSTLYIQMGSKRIGPLRGSRETLRGLNQAFKEVAKAVI